MSPPTPSSNTRPCPFWTNFQLAPSPPLSTDRPPQPWQSFPGQAGEALCSATHSSAPNPPAILWPAAHSSVPTLPQYCELRHTRLFQPPRYCDAGTTSLQLTYSAPHALLCSARHDRCCTEGFCLAKDTKPYPIGMISPEAYSIVGKDGHLCGIGLPCCFIGLKKPNTCVNGAVSEPSVGCAWPPSPPSPCSSAHTHTHTHTHTRARARYEQHQQEKLTRHATHTHTHLSTKRSNTVCASSRGRSARAAATSPAACAPSASFSAFRRSASSRSHRPTSP
jgi:hypothetical protein